MALFGKGNKQSSALPEVHPLPGRPQVYCMVCKDYRAFTRCWQRAQRVRQCTGCEAMLEDVDKLYARNQPACPHCGEFLEQPGFDYGFCDTCGSKHEIVEGTKPGLLPNRKQREAMEQVGRSWSND